jgi:methylated-DNA-[protein]-cysteine S-methyltransferase
MLKLRYYSSPIGTLIIGWGEDVLRLLVFDKPDMRAIDHAELYGFFRSILTNDPIPPTINTWLDTFFGGGTPAESPTLLADGTPLQKDVWRALRKIPYGVTRTYGELAEMVGHPSAVRAVASACGKNPISLIIPCHRIVQKDGTLGGYAGGLDKKRWLIDWEAKHRRGPALWVVKQEEVEG